MLVSKSKSTGHDQQHEPLLFSWKLGANSGNFFGSLLSDPARIRRWSSAVVQRPRPALQTVGHRNIALSGRGRVYPIVYTLLAVRGRSPLRSVFRSLHSFWPWVSPRPGRHNIFCILSFFLFFFSFFLHFHLLSFLFHSSFRLLPLVSKRKILMPVRVPGKADARGRSHASLQ
jgi:hypothetical protein